MFSKGYDFLNNIATFDQVWFNIYVIKGFSLEATRKAEFISKVSYKFKIPFEKE